MGALIVFGYGPGISHATAGRFGREGYRLALVGRTAERLAEGARRLKADGFDARAYRCDAADPTMIRRTVGENTAQADGFAKLLGIDGVGLENAAKSKLVGILAERLRGFDVYVGEVTIAGSVAGTATATPTAIDPSAVADTFWSLRQRRDRTRVRLTE
ncbi:MAG: SDR family NAD(P)-dependent oxidoreductase [Streptosporangiaceae bacterium]